MRLKTHTRTRSQSITYMKAHVRKLQTISEKLLHVKATLKNDTTVNDYKSKPLTRNSTTTSTVILPTMSAR